MENFDFYNPTKIIFGKDCADKIPENIKWKKALIIIGKNTVKKNGFYARIISLLNMSGLDHVTFEGVESNPNSKLADEAVQVAKNFGAEVVIALGGGSVIDTAKAVSIGFYVDHSVWDFYTAKAVPQKALPIFCILTLAACGTENNNFSFLQNDAEGLKKGISSNFFFPDVSFLDPTLTFSVGRECTAYGISNLIAHSLEQYFGRGNSSVSDEYAASVIKLAIQNGPVAINDPCNYESRSVIMWLSASTLSGFIKAGKGQPDWACHGIEQTLNVLFNIQHGAGLSVIYPAWLKHFKSKLIPQIAFLGKQIFGITDPDAAKSADLFISMLEDFYSKISAPIRLSQLGIGPEQEEKIINNLILNKVNGNNHRLNEQDYRQLLQYMY